MESKSEKVCLLTTPDGKGHIYMQPFPMAEKFRDFVSKLELIERPPIVVYGKECRQNRNVKFFSDASEGYQYSQILATSYPMTDELREIAACVNEMFGDQFNGVLINRYMDGNDCIGAHRDSEKSLGKAGIVGIVYGATRKFRIRDYKTKKIVADLVIPDGYVYHMDHEFNKIYTHEIPVEKKVKGTRVSLTFRYHQK